MRCDKAMILYRPQNSPDMDPFPSERRRGWVITDVQQGPLCLPIVSRSWACISVQHLTCYMEAAFLLQGLPGRRKKEKDGESNQSPKLKLSERRPPLGIELYLHLLGLCNDFGRHHKDPSDKQCVSLGELRGWIQSAQVITGWLRTWREGYHPTVRQRDARPTQGKHHRLLLWSRALAPGYSPRCMGVEAASRCSLLASHSGRRNVAMSLT